MLFVHHQIKSFLGHKLHVYDQIHVVAASLSRARWVETHSHSPDRDVLLVVHGQREYAYLRVLYPSTHLDHAGIEMPSFRVGEYGDSRKLWSGVLLGSQGWWSYLKDIWYLASWLNVRYFQGIKLRRFGSVFEVDSDRRPGDLTISRDSHQLEFYNDMGVYWASQWWLEFLESTGLSGVASMDEELAGW